jgi:hypothetical protein
MPPYTKLCKTHSLLKWGSYGDPMGLPDRAQMPYSACQT